MDIRPCVLSEVEFADHIGQLSRQVTEHWLLGLRENNPALLDMFRDKNRAPYRCLLPWSGEFVGKYLTSCAAIYRLTKDLRIKEECLSVIEELYSYQEPNGYLGPFPEEYQLTGTAPEKTLLDDKDAVNFTTETWDAWGHYHIMIGLLSWYDLVKDQRMMDCVERMAGLFLKLFYGETGRRVIDMGSSEMNLAPYHAFTMLYNRTGDARYLSFAKEMEKDCSDERAGNYLEYARQNLPFYQCPKPRWESIHVILGFVEMAKAVGDPEYLEAAKQIFYSILETDVHNTGGFSTREQAVGNPYDFGAVETCCVVAYDVLAVQLYHATGDPKIVDFLERSLYNAVAGSFVKTGRWSTYNTPMEGFRRANIHEINFQCRPGSPELNCCSVNAPRGIGLLSDWAYMQQKDGLLINYYGRSHFTTEDGDEVRISGNYPFEREIKIQAKLSNGKKLRLRIPGFCDDYRISDTVHFNKVGEMWESDGTGFLSMTVIFSLPFQLQLGEKDCQGRYCVFRGPILLGYDNGENPEVFLKDVPMLSLDQLQNASIQIQKDGKMEVAIPVGEKSLKLHDFYSLGQSGSWYTTWFYQNI